MKENLVVFGGGAIYQRGYSKALREIPHIVYDPKLNKTELPDRIDRAIITAPLEYRGGIYDLLPPNIPILIEKPVLWVGHRKPPDNSNVSHNYLYDPRWQHIIRLGINRLNVRFTGVWPYTTSWRHPEKRWTWADAEEGWHYIYLAKKLWPNADIMITETEFNRCTIIATEGDIERMNVRLGYEEGKLTEGDYNGAYFRLRKHGIESEDKRLALNFDPEYDLFVSSIENCVNAFLNGQSATLSEAKQVLDVILKSI